MKQALKYITEYVVITLIIQSCGAYAKDCQGVVDSCKVLVTEQAEYIQVLKGQVKDLEGRVEDSDSPSLLWILAGVIIGGFVYTVAPKGH